MITIHHVLGRYIARHYLMMVILFLGGIVGVMALFDFLELLRRAGKVGDIGLDFVVFLTCLKVPGNVVLIAPFALLFAAMMTLHQFLKRQELVVMRASGASVWQILSPLFIVSLGVGVVLVGVMHPMAAATKAQFRTYEGQYFKKEQHLIALLNQGLWLRQKTADEGYVLLHAERVSVPQWEIQDVTALFFAPDHTLMKRLDAPRGVLQNRDWVFDVATIQTDALMPQAPAPFTLPGILSAQDLVENFSSPETISFWEMPSYIAMMEATGLPVGSLRVQYLALWFFPLMGLGLVMLAGAVMIRPPRSGAPTRAAVMGILIGFVLFFLTNFMQALGSAGQIPVLLGAGAPTFLTLALGVMAIFTLEDR